MKKIAFLALFIISINDSFSQALWASFPSESRSTSAIIVGWNGKPFLTSKETTGYYGTEIIVTSNYITIGTDKFTFDANDFETYGSGLVFYKAKDKWGKVYKLYFDINVPDYGGRHNKPAVKALHLIKEGGTDTRTFLIY